MEGTKSGWTVHEAKAKEQNVAIKSSAEKGEGHRGAIPTKPHRSTSTSGTGRKYTSSSVSGSYLSQGSAEGASSAQAAQTSKGAIEWMDGNGVGHEGDLGTIGQLLTRDVHSHKLESSPGVPEEIEEVLGNIELAAPHMLDARASPEK